MNLCEDSILDVYMEHVQEGVTRDKIQTLMSNETWFDSKKMQQYFNVEIEEKAAVAACASDFFEKYNNFCKELATGILNIRTKYQPDIMYRTEYLSCNQFTQFMRGIAKFSLKLVEYNPSPENRTI